MLAYEITEVKVNCTCFNGERSVDRTFCFWRLVIFLPKLHSHLMNTNAQLACAFVIAQELSSLDTMKPETVSEKLFGQMTTLTGGFVQGPDLPELHDARCPKPQSTVRPDLEELGDAKLVQWTRYVSKAKLE